MFSSRFKGLFGHRIAVGRVALPMWTWLSLVGALGVAAVVGQAVGPVLAGNVTGNTNVTAQQSIVVTNASSVEVGNPTNKGLVVVNDQGTSFTAALQQHVGDQGQKLDLNILNRSNATSSIVLQLKIPRGINIQADSANTSTLKEAIFNTSADKTSQSMLLSLRSSTSTDLDLTLESNDDAAPGTYTISGTLVQIAG